MKANSSFDRAMSQIVAQAEAERNHEIKAQQRAEFIGRAGKVAVWLFIATIFIFAFTFRNQMGEVMDLMLPAKKAGSLAHAGSARSIMLGLAGTNNVSGTNSSGEPTGQAAATLQGAAQNAMARDSLIENLSSGAK